MEGMVGKGIAALGPADVTKLRIPVSGAMSRGM